MSAPAPFPPEASPLHPRNRHRDRYDFPALIAACPDLGRHVTVNVRGQETLDFFSAEAVRLLNQALLRVHYGIAHWDLPPGYLCPPVPGRADYVHHLADLLAADCAGEIPRGKAVRCLDIGTGANCIYPILGVVEYGWRFTGTDIDPVSVKNARTLVQFNPPLKGQIEVREQARAQQIFRGVVLPGERYALSLCNPPFHSSQAEAQAGALRKLNSLTQQKHAAASLNFGGQHNELWCEGGELRFLGNMIRESADYAPQFAWFTSLISRKWHLRDLEKALKQVQAAEVRVIPMAQGNKVSRMLAWTFHSAETRRTWLP